MAGAPTEAEVQEQWRNAVALLEATRVFADGSVVPAGGLLDTLQQSLEGEYTPEALANATAAYRAALSDLVSSDRAQGFLVPVLQEYAELLSVGGGYRDIPSTARALYERFHNNGLRVQSRNITYDGAPDYGFSNRGFGILSRLVVDENGYYLEACHAEKKEFRCRRDSNSGTRKYAELWEVIGDREGRDALLRAQFGSGERSSTSVISRHAGTGAGGSMLTNSSFESFVTDGDPKFRGWSQTSGIASQIQQSTTIYRQIPNSASDGSLRLNSGDPVTVRQPLSSWRARNINPDRPYFLRVMANREDGTAVGGSLTIRLGEASRSVPVSSLPASGWLEVTILPSRDLWFRRFNNDELAVEIEWSGSTSGYVLVDDVILTPWDLIDGTFWCLRGSNDPWLLDDTITFQDTGGAPETAKIQWWFFVAGLGYLPSTAVGPNFEDPN